MLTTTIQRKPEPKIAGVHPKIASLCTTGDLAAPVKVSLIQRKSSCACGGGCPRCQSRSIIQAKLTIGAPNDKYEQEADRVAEQKYGVKA